MGDTKSSLAPQKVPSVLRVGKTGARALRLGTAGQVQGAGKAAGAVSLQ